MSLRLCDAYALLLITCAHSIAAVPLLPHPSVDTRASLRRVPLPSQSKNSTAATLPITRGYEIIRSGVDVQRASSSAGSFAHAALHAR